MVRSDDFINRHLHNFIDFCFVDQHSFHILFSSDCALRRSQDWAVNLLSSAQLLLLMKTQAYRRWTELSRKSYNSQNTCFNIWYRKFIHSQRQSQRQARELWTRRQRFIIWWSDSKKFVAQYEIYITWLIMRARIINHVFLYFFSWDQSSFDDDDTNESDVERFISGTLCSLNHSQADSYIDIERDSEASLRILEVEFKRKLCHASWQSETCDDKTQRASSTETAAWKEETQAAAVQSWAH